MRNEYEDYAKGFSDRVNGRGARWSDKARPAYRAGWIQGGHVNDPDPRASLPRGAGAKLYLYA